MSADRPQLDRIPAGEVRSRAFEAVRAVLSDDHNHEGGISAAHAVASDLAAEFGTDAIVEVVVELASRLGQALERIAADHGLTAADLADVWFLD